MDQPTREYFDNLQNEYANDPDHRIEIVAVRPYAIGDSTNDFLMLCALGLGLSLLFVLSFKHADATTK